MNFNLLKGRSACFELISHSWIEIKKTNYVAIRGNFLVYDDKKKIVTKLIPENRFYPVTKIITTEASIHSNLLRDLYIVLGEGSLNNGL